jgi:molecular chaperone DnaK
MVKEAEAHAEEDKRRRALIEARNQAESLIHTTEKSLTEHGGKLGEGDKTAIETALSALKSAVAGNDTGEIETKSRALIQVSTKFAEAASAAAQAQTGGGDRHAASQGTGGENVVDAEFEDVDDHKRSQ